MKSSELHHLFVHKLKPSLRRLEAERKIIQFNVTLAVVGLIGLAIGFTNLDRNILNPMLGAGLILIGATLMIWNGYLAQTRYSEYKRKFKNRVVAEIFDFIEPNLIYSPELCIPESIYHQSELFLTDVDRYGGDDYCRGQLDKTDYEFSELHTEYKTETRDSNGRRRTQWHTIFQGMFFSADFHKHIKSETFVLPDTAEKTFGSWIGKFFQSKNFSRDQLVKMEDPEFERHFVVYSDDQIDARYILTPDMMKRIIEIYNKVGRKIYLSFKDTRVYVAISHNKNHFEPKLFSSGVKFTHIQEMHALLSNTIGLIKDLNLNTRIWTKN